MSGILLITRPFGVALGMFIVVNLGLALKEPRLAANDVWLAVPLEEPWLSIFVAVLGVMLLTPHSWSARSGFRIFQVGVLIGFLILAVTNLGRFYYIQLFSDRIESHAVFPFSLLISLILLFETLRVGFWKPMTRRLPRPARVFFGGILVAVSCFIMILAHIYTFGKTDYSGFVKSADAVIVLGAKVYRDGRLSNALEYRMNRAIDLYKQGKARHLILTGGIDASNLSEPRMMQRYAEERGVPGKAIILDEKGDTTYDSAINCRGVATAKELDSFFVVSQYFHMARVKMIFERNGLPCYTVPADLTHPLQRERFFLFREAVAFPVYLLFRH